jgi:hypothetical protein
MDMFPADYTPFIYKAADKTITAATERNASDSRVSHVFDNSVVYRSFLLVVACNAPGYCLYRVLLLHRCTRGIPLMRTHTVWHLSQLLIETDDTLLLLLLLLLNQMPLNRLLLQSVVAAAMIQTLLLKWIAVLRLMTAHIQQQHQHQQQSKTRHAILR